MFALRHGPLAGLILAPCLALLGSTLAAQKTYTVGGSNPNYTTLTAAVSASAVKDGDVLLVRRGFYAAPDIQKALTILGEPGSSLVLQKDSKLTTLDKPIAISGIGKGKSVTLQNFTIYYYLPMGGWIQVLNCGGRVHLENIVVNFSLTSINRGPNGDVEIRDSAAVTLRNCTFDGLTTVQNSKLSAVDCRFKGWHGFVNFKGIISPSTPGIDVTKGSHVTLAQVSSIGGNGAAGTNSVAKPSPGVACNGSVLTLSGATGTLFQAGVLSKHDTPGAAGSNLATLFLDPRVQLKPSGTAKKHDGFWKAFVRDQPVVLVTGGDLGKASTTELRARKGHVYHLVGGLLRNQAPLSLPPFDGLFWLETSTMLYLSSGTVGATDQVKLTATLPDKTFLRGISLGLQALAGPATGPYSLSNVGVIALH